MRIELFYIDGWSRVNPADSLWCCWLSDRWHQQAGSLCGSQDELPLWAALGGLREDCPWHHSRALFCRRVFFTQSSRTPHVLLTRVTRMYMWLGPGCYLQIPYCGWVQPVLLTSSVVAVAHGDTSQQKPVSTLVSARGGTE